MPSNPKTSIRIPLLGGIGNQLFQFAAGLAITKRNSVEIQYFDDLIAGSKFLGITPRTVVIESLISNKVASLGKIEMLKMVGKKYAIRDYWLNDTVIDPLDLGQISSNTRVVSGYFQSRFIVDEIFDLVLESLKRSAEFAQLIPTTQRNEITVHMRLGDKLSRKELKFFGQTSTAYYLNGIRELSNGDSFSAINIVSDQPNLARQLLQSNELKQKLNFIRGNNELDDLAVITHSRGIVMSCSSFSWWGARLASINPSTRVVSPRTWLRRASEFDLYMNYPKWQLMSKN